MLLGLSLSAAVALTPLPPKVNTEVGRVAWEQYSRDTLTKLFPEYAEAFKTRPLIISDSPEANAHRDGRLLTFDFGLVALMEDEAEYASVLAHELGHVMLSHESTTLYSGMFTPAGDDMVLLEKQETEADRFGLLVLQRAGFPPCASARALTRTLDSNGMRAHANNIYVAVNLRREEALVHFCSLPPQMLATGKDEFKTAMWRVYADVVVRQVWPKSSPFKGLIVLNDETFLGRAESGTGNLLLGPGLIRLVQEPDDIAFFAAHELRHLNEKHQRTYVTVNGQEVPDYEKMERMELDADRWAFELLRSRGRNACAGLTFARRLAEHFDATADPTDPYNSIAFKRIAALQKLCPAR